MDSHILEENCCTVDKGSLESRSTNKNGKQPFKEMDFPTISNQAGQASGIRVDRNWNKKNPLCNRYCEMTDCVRGFVIFVKLCLTWSVL